MVKFKYILEKNGELPTGSRPVLRPDITVNYMKDTEGELLELGEGVDGQVCLGTLTYPGDAILLITVALKRFRKSKDIEDMVKDVGIAMYLTSRCKEQNQSKVVPACEGLAYIYLPSPDFHPTVAVNEFVGNAITGESLTLKDSLNNPKEKLGYIPTADQWIAIANDIVKKVVIIHGHFVVLGDLKPDNVLLYQEHNSQLHACLIDYGCATYIVNDLEYFNLAKRADWGGMGSIFKSMHEKCNIHWFEALEKRCHYEVDFDWLLGAFEEEQSRSVPKQETNCNVAPGE